MDEHEGGHRRSTGYRNDPAPEARVSIGVRADGHRELVADGLHDSASATLAPAGEGIIGTAGEASSGPMPTRHSMMAEDRAPSSAQHVRIERIAQAIANEIDREDRQRNHRARWNPQPRHRLQHGERLRVGQHVAPARCRRLHT